MRVKTRKNQIEQVIGIGLVDFGKDCPKEAGTVVIEIRVQHSVKLLTEYLTYYGVESLRALDDFESRCYSYAEKNMTYEEALEDAKKRIDRFYHKGYMSVADLLYVENDGIDEADFENAEKLFVD